MLWVALELPALPLQVAERGGTASEPWVIADGPLQRPVVACANEAAQALGVREGQAVAAARARAGEMRVIRRDAAQEKDALERLAAWAGQYTPMVSIEPTGLVMEVSSSLRLFHGHARLTAAILRGARDLGFRVAPGVAPTPLAARLFARAEAQGRPVRTCLSMADLAERAGELPLFLLDWPPKTLARLADLGVLRWRDVLDLPSAGVARRFGPEIALAIAKLMGQVADPREPYTPPACFHSRLELPAEADGVEALRFPLKRLLAEFEGAVRGRGAGVQSLALVLEHGRRQRTRLALDFASPEREADFILGIAREKLGRLRLPAPTIALVLHARALLPYVPRTRAWLPGAQEQALEGERLVERLAARLGRDRVFGIAPGNDHRPERNWRPAFAATVDKAPRPTAGARAAFVTAARPAWLLHRPQRLVCTDGLPMLQGALALRAGPERIEAGWWDGDEVHRDYFVATNARGEAYWVYRELRAPGAWYLHGVFA